MKLLPVILVLALFAPTVWGQMQSSNYQIQQDSINFGGNNSASANYGLEDTMGEVATGRSSSTNYQIDAGYQQLQDYELTLTSPADVSLSISGISDNQDDASITWTVDSSDPDGYELSIRSTTDPAMSSVDDQLSDYVPASADPDYDFVTDSNDALFGFSPEGVDVVDKFKDNGSSCNIGSNITSLKCWDGFTTTDSLISSRVGAADSVDTTIKVRAYNGGNHMLLPGDYSATVTLTLVSL